MSKSLFIFMISTNVDTYINPITHCFEHLKVSSVYLTYVKNAPTGLKSDRQAKELVENIKEQFITLSNGKYKDFSRAYTDPSKEIEPNIKSLDGQNTSIYGEAYSSLMFKPYTIDYNNLKEGIESIVQHNHDANFCILDVTAASKVPSIELFGFALAMNIKHIHVFELSIRHDRDDPVKSLYHNVSGMHSESLNGDIYKYANLASKIPEVFKDSSKAIFVEGLKLSVHKMAESQANRIAWFIGFVILLLFILVIWIFQQIGWTQFEPWVWLIPFILAFIMFFYSLFTGKKLPPADKLRNHFFEARKKKLYEQLGIRDNTSKTKD